MWVAVTRAGCCVVAFGGSEKSRLVTASANARSYVQQCNNFENRLRFDKVRDSLKVGRFFETLGRDNCSPLTFLSLI